MWSRIKELASKAKAGEQDRRTRERALQQEPDNPELHHALGLLAEQQRDFEEAEARFRQAAALQPANALYGASLARLLLGLNRLDEAIAIHESLLREDPSDAQAHFGLGAALVRAGEMERGLAHLGEAVALQSGSAEMWIELGNAQFRHTQLEQAAGSFGQAVRCRPDYAEAHNNLGLTMRMLGRLAQAEHSFLEAVRHAPANAGAHANLADTLVLQGRPGEAVTYHQKALALEPDNPRLHFAVAAALAADGRPQDAIAYYRSAIERDPAHALAHCNLGLALAELGKADDAEAALRRAAALAPNDKTIAANLRMIAGSRIQRWHFSMMNDGLRNRAYENAIREQVTEGARVLEIGTGSGLLAMMAAQAGARHVTTCEMVRPLALKADQIISKNGFRRKIAVIGRNSATLKVPDDLPERADVLISEIVSSDLLGEGILATMEDALERLLKPQAAVIPARAVIVAQLAGSAQLEPYLQVGTVSGFDLSPFNEFCPVTLEPAEFGIRMEFQSDRFDAFDFDFTQHARFPAQERRIAVTCTESGVCHGVLQWIRLHLSRNHQFENAPDSSHTGNSGSNGHWRQTLYTFAEPIFIEQGQVVHLVAAHNRSNLMFYLERVE